MNAYLFDTMVLTEGQKAIPDARLARWLGSVLVTQTYTSTLNIGEIRYGISRLPGGKRREELQQWLTQVLIAGFADRIIPFDTRAALASGDILANAARRGSNMASADAHIAAIARIHSLALVTRNARRFADCGIDVIDPWA